MNTGECSCNDRYEEDDICNNSKPVSRCRSLSDSNDFYQQISHIKHRVVKLTCEQIEKSRNNQVINYQRLRIIAF